MLGQRSWIQQPGVGNDFLQLGEIFFTEFASPKFAQRLKPEQREPHFLLEIGFDGRRDSDSAFCICTEHLFNAGNIWQIEQFKEPIRRAPILWLIIFCGRYAPTVAGSVGVDRAKSTGGSGVRAFGYSALI